MAEIRKPTWMRMKMLRPREVLLRAWTNATGLNTRGEKEWQLCERRLVGGAIVRYQKQHAHAACRALPVNVRPPPNTLQPRVTADALAVSSPLSLPVFEPRDLPKRCMTIDWRSGTGRSNRQCYTQFRHKCLPVRFGGFRRMQCLHKSNGDLNRVCYWRPEVANRTASSTL